MKKIIFLLLAVCGTLHASAQAYMDLRINEILVKNVDSYADDHAHKVGWIELFNGSYSNVNVAGMHLRFIQGGDTIDYRIPKTDSRTQMAAQGYLIFYADSSSNRGTFHTNFALDVVDSARLEKLVNLNDRLELLDQSGRNVIDAIEYDVNTQIPDVSFGRAQAPDGTYNHELLSSITPMQSNEVGEDTPKNERFRQQDPVGIAMSLIAMTVVFLALIGLYLVFRYLGKYMHHINPARREQVAKEAAASALVDSQVKAMEGELNGETLAAIATAIRLYENDMHDIESTVLTINRVARAYSPWNSKIYSLLQLPNKK
ncbi:MAG: OadG family transporter subunit [Mucinivorans sp.]